MIFYIVCIKPGEYFVYGIYNKIIEKLQKFPCVWLFSEKYNRKWESKVSKNKFIDTVSVILNTEVDDLVWKRVFRPI